MSENPSQNPWETEQPTTTKIRRSPAVASGKVCKKPIIKKTKEELKAAMSSIPSEFNTLVVGGSVHKRFLQSISPDNFVFLFYDTPKVWPTSDYTPKIEGYTLEEINQGICDNISEREHKVVSKPHKFKNGKKEQVFAVDYNGAQYKVKYGSLKPNGHPYFFIEYLKDQFNPDPEISESGIRYYGEFLTKSVSSFGKKKKKMSKLSSDLEYLLKL
jgi:hypothetical protein